MPVDTISEGWLCDDCLFAVANGDYPEDAERSAAVEAGERRAAELSADGRGHVVLDCDAETGEGIREFSWSSCNLCRSHLGGQRHRYAVLGVSK